MFILISLITPMNIQQLWIQATKYIPTIIMDGVEKVKAEVQSYFPLTSKPQTLNKRVACPQQYSTSDPPPPKHPKILSYFEQIVWINNNSNYSHEQVMLKVHYGALFKAFNNCIQAISYYQQNDHCKQLLILCSSAQLQLFQNHIPLQNIDGKHGFLIFCENNSKAHLIGQEYQNITLQPYWSINEMNQKIAEIQAIYIQKLRAKSNNCCSSSKLFIWVVESISHCQNIPWKLMECLQQFGVQVLVKSEVQCGQLIRRKLTEASFTPHEYQNIKAESFSIVLITECPWIDVTTLKNLGTQIASVCCILITSAEAAKRNLSNCEILQRRSFDIVVHNREEMETAVICSLQM